MFGLLTDGIVFTLGIKVKCFFISSYLLRWDWAPEQKATLRALVWRVFTAIQHSCDIDILPIVWLAGNPLNSRRKNPIAKEHCGISTLRSTGWRYTV